MWVILQTGPAAVGSSGASGGAKKVTDHVVFPRKVAPSARRAPIPHVRS